MAPFGKETTAAECRERAAWERATAKRIRASAPYGPIIAVGHENAAAAYDRLAEKKEREEADALR
jgi:hypothetical protein